jgi:23S rRNA pseudouridine1911/1915/1917 synthase
VRLDLLLIRRHPELSRRKARDVVEKGQVDVDGRTVCAAGADVDAGARVSWEPNRKARPRVRPPLPLLYADDALLIVDKPAGLLAVPSAAGAREDTVAARIGDYVSRLRPRLPYVGVVHRLDRDTSGALALALEPRTRDALRALFRAHLVERRYLALVAGAPAQAQGTIEVPIRDAYIAGRRGVARREEPQKPARTRYSVRERFRAASLLEIELDTGRQHQIRIHLAHVGAPVLGDLVYGRPCAGIAAPRHMLHAEVLGFTHPVSGAALRVTSPLPADFTRVLDELRREARRAPGAPKRSRARPGSR